MPPDKKSPLIGSHDWRLGYHVLRILLGLMFLATGISKALAPLSFRASLQAYQLTPAAWSTPLAALVILVELAIGSMLLVNLAIRWSSLIAAILLAVFTGAIALAWRHGLAIDCGCFLGSQEPVGPVAVIRDAALLLLTVLLASYSWRKPASASVMERV